ncbi:MAG: phosphoribosylaminoimidazolesuccinocarboxamide synthase [Patescibacteria group bacterium]
MKYQAIIAKNLNNCLTETNLGIGKKHLGKVRDAYELGDKMILVTTDRQSAFDRVLASIPFKGQVLNQTSAWWFQNTKHIIDNHVLAIPDPNVTVGKKCAVFPVEFVVRGYLTGSTGTSAWVNYAKGVRNFCGNILPEGLKKNQKFDSPIITPTTKFEEHDRNVSPEEIVNEKMMTQEDYEFVADKARKLFAFGQETALIHGLILVDTKYEFGKDAAGNILIIDELHTPDSSRYWIADSYKEKIAAGQEPENIDKEFLRLWFKENCDPYKDAVLPLAPDELVVELSRRYIQLYEMITGMSFAFPDTGMHVEERIKKNLHLLK